VFTYAIPIEKAMHKFRRGESRRAQQEVSHGREGNSGKYEDLVTASRDSKEKMPRRRPRKDLERGRKWWEDGSAFFFQKSRDQWEKRGGHVCRKFAEKHQTPYLISQGEGKHTRGRNLTQIVRLRSGGRLSSHELRRKVLSTTHRMEREGS